MASRRKRRPTRRIVLGLAVIAAFAITVNRGVKWISSGDPTELTSTLAADEEAVKGKPALRPITPPGQTAGSEEGSGKVLRPNGIGDAGGVAGGESDDVEIPPLRSRDTAPVVPTPPATPPGRVTRLPADEAARELEAGFAALQREELVTARAHLNSALHSGLSPTDEKRVRQALTDLARQTIFSRLVFENDPLVERYVVKSGDRLQLIARRYKVSENLLAEINALPRKDFIRAGAPLKVVCGPFHAAVVKRDHALHVYLQDVYICTYGVALGQDGSTPTGTWKAINHLENPSWVDPVTGKRWHPDDPSNPIGEFWIGLEGIEGEAVGKVGFGIHGTIEPETIGQDVSLGCVRLAADDIAALYKYLVPGASLITITD